MSKTANYRPLRFLTNDENYVASATVGSGGVKPVAAVEVGRPEEVVRAEGGDLGDSTGEVTAVGDFESDADVQNVIVQIVTGGTTSQVSEAEFDGAGDGTMSALTVPTTAVEERIDVVCVDRDATPTLSILDIQGFEVIARELGAKRITISASSNIMRSVDPVGIVLSPLVADTSETDIETMNFGAFQLTGAGEYDPQHNRIVFDNVGPETHRQYIDPRNGKDFFVFDPPIQRDVPVGTLVYAVTEGWDITIDDGVNPAQTFTNLITWFDLLQELVSAERITVTQPITPLKRPGGIAVTDINIKSTATLLAAMGVPADSDVTNRLEIPTDLVIDPNATADRVIATVTDALPGAEVWTWTNGQGTILGTSISGETFAGGGVTATIPVRQPIVNQTTTDIILSEMQPGTKLDGSQNDFTNGIPEPCFVGGVGFGWMIGPYFPGSLRLTFTYRPKPTDECSCDNADFSGRLDPACLDLDPLTFGSDFILTDFSADQASRVQSMYEWIDEGKRLYNLSINSNIAPAQGPTMLDATESGENRMYDYICRGLIKLALEVVPLAGPFNQHTGPALTGSQIWDVAFTEFQNLPIFALLRQAPNTDFSELRTFSAQTMGSVFQTIIDRAYAKAHLNPKANAAIQGDGWWQTEDNDFRWEVTDDAGKVYGWLDAGRPWYMAVRDYDSDGNEIYTDTKMLALHIKISCPDLWTDGNFFTVDVNGDGAQAGYKQNDAYNFTFSAPRPLIVSGGVNGGFTRTFRPLGSVTGTFTGDDYILNIQTPLAYNSATIPGLSFLIEEGPEAEHEIGDVYSFQINRNQFRVSTDEGATYSAAADLPIAPAIATVALPAPSAASTLGFLFTPGVGVSYRPGDQFEWNLQGVYGGGNVRSLDERTHQVNGALSRTYTFASALPVSMVAILSTGDVTVELFNAAVSVAGPFNLMGGNDPTFQALIDNNTSVTADSIVVTSADFTGQALRWVYAGPTVSVRRADRIIPTRVQRRSEGAGLNPKRLRYGRGNGVAIEWKHPPGRGSLRTADTFALRDLMDKMCETGETFVFVPNYRLSRAMSVRWDSDQFAEDDILGYQGDIEDRHRVAARINLSPELYA